VFAVSSDELPARVFLTYFTRKSAFKRFGFHPAGTIGLWHALVEAIEANGGTVLLSTEVTQIRTADCVITGVVLERGPETVEVDAPVVVSNVGPWRTAALVGEENLPDEYRATLDGTYRPCSMITVNFASQKRLIEAPGMLSFAKSRRLAYIANYTDICPEMSPDGWNLYVGTAVPEPAIGDFDEAAETEILLEDLREQIPGFDADARILSIVTTRNGWPPQRAVAGYDLPHDTPLLGLWNVGDAVKEYANGGTTACAETAEIVVRKIRSALPLGA
jgi:phytoene desaturase